LPSAFPLEAIVLDRAASATLHRQLYGHLRALIERKVLPSGGSLPSTRLLSKDLKLGRNTVIAAYDQLALEGYLVMRRCAPPVVVDLPAHGLAAGPTNRRPMARLSRRGKVMTSQPYHHGRPGMLAFHPGLPDAGNFPFNTWSKLLARRAKGAGHDLFGAYHIGGYPPLREAIARYLWASRGINCAAEEIVVTNGAQSAFDLLARILLDPGERVWMEEPGYYGARAAFLSAGAKLDALKVDEDGWRLDPPRIAPRVIFVTPSCHHPLGVTMPMEQRLKLIQLAEAWNSWIIEDDYDGEYRFQGQPIPSLQGISAANRVVCVGTFAKILFPAMRLGFMVVPAAMAKGLVAGLSATGQFAPLLTQAALADFISEGHFTRHLRRMRRLYASRRQVFMDLCDRELTPWLRLSRSESGIQLVGLLRSGIDDRMVAAAAARRGVNVSPLSLQYWRADKRQGLVMGFASADERNMRLAAGALRNVLRELC
jgi:GntR family transcriptional regulator/MocR family aminotransferase